MNTLSSLCNLQRFGVATTMLALLLLAGCGYKGPLTHPPAGSDSKQTTPAADTMPSGDEETLDDD